MTDDQYAEFLQTVNDIASAAPSLVSAWDSEGNAILKAGSNVSDLNKQISDYLTLQRDITHYNTKDNIADQYKGLLTESKQAQSEMDMYQSQADYAQTRYDSLNSLYETLEKGENKGAQVFAVSNDDEMALRQQLLDAEAYVNSWQNEDGTISLNIDTSQIDEDELSGILTTIGQIRDEASAIQAENLQKLQNTRALNESNWREIFPSIQSLVDTTSLFDSWDDQELATTFKDNISSMVSSMNMSDISKSIEKSGKDIYDWTMEDVIQPLSQASEQQQETWNELFNFEPDKNESISAAAKRRDALLEEVAAFSDEDFWTKSTLAKALGYAHVDENGNTVWNTQEKLNQAQEAMESQGEELRAWMKELNEEDFEIAYSIVTSGDEEAFENLKKFQNAFEEARTATSSESEDISQAFSTISKDTNTLLSQITAINSALDSQSTGKSISIDDFNSDELKDYASALEYVNGSMQINAEKAREIAKAKAEEQIATNDVNKALQQSKYMQNIAEIEKLQDELLNLTNAKDENADAIRSSIDALLSENDSIVNQCSQLDILSASLREATGAYENWLSKQNTAESGDMFDDSLGAMQAIDDVSDKESDDYGRIGTNKYKAAVELVIPDTVDAENQEAVQSYMDSIASYFTYDKDGNRAGLNIEEFCQRAMDKGLMVLDESGKNYEVAGQRTMEDFAEGLNLSMPVVQAMFGEMEEFGGKFTWADEAIQTLGDMGMAAGEAKSRFEEISGDGNSIQIDVSDLDNAEDKISVLDNTILQMQELKARPDIDPSSIEDANAIIQYCVTQKQMLEAPVVMSVNADNVSDELSTAVSLLQQFQEAQNNVALQAAIGADTSEAEGKVQELTGEIQGLSPKIQAKLNIDATSTDTIIASIQEMTPEVLVHAGIDASEVEAYQKSEHDSQGTVQWDNDTGIVDAWASQMHTSMGTVTWKNDITVVKTQFSAEGIVNWSNTTPPSSGTNGLNGTAHAKGTVYPHLVGHAHVNGNWGTKTGGVSLVGELGPEILVHPSGFWEEIGANGAEFRYIPKNSIIFNHLQTESLLEQGFVNSRGHAYLSGTALVRGAISVSQANKRPKGTYTYSSNSGNSNIAATNSNTEATKDNTDATKKSTQTFDWVKVRLEYFADKTKAIADTITDYVTSTFKAKQLQRQIKSIDKEVTANKYARDAYMKKARETNRHYEYQDDEGNTKSLSIPVKYRKLVHQGAWKIEDMDTSTTEKKALAEAIQTYQGYYEQAQDCKQAVVELRNEQLKLFEDLMNVPTEEAEKKIKKLTASYNGLEAIQSRLSAANKGASTQKQLVDVMKQDLDTASATATAAQQKLESAKSSTASATAAQTQATSSLASAKKALLKTNLTDAQKKAVKAGKTISTSDMTKAQKKKADAYNKALKELASAKKKVSSANSAQQSAQLEADAADAAYKTFSTNYDKAIDQYDSGNSLGHL